MLYSDIYTVLTFNYNGKHLSQIHRGLRLQAPSSLQYRLVRLHGAVNKKKLQAAQKHERSLKTQLGFCRLLEGNWQHWQGGAGCSLLSMGRTLLKVAAEC